MSREIWGILSQNGRLIEVLFDEESLFCSRTRLQSRLY